MNHEGTQTGIIRGWVVLNIDSRLSEHEIAELQSEIGSPLICPFAVQWRVKPKHMRREGQPNRTKTVKQLFEGYAFLRPENDDHFLAALAHSSVYGSVRTYTGYCTMRDRDMNEVIEVTSDGRYDDPDPGAPKIELGRAKKVSIEELIGSKVTITRGPLAGLEGEIGKLRYSDVGVKLEGLDFPFYVEPEDLLISEEQEYRTQD